MKPFSAEELGDLAFWATCVCVTIGLCQLFDASLGTTVYHCGCATAGYAAGVYLERYRGSHKD